MQQFCPAIAQQATRTPLLSTSGGVNPRPSKPLVAGSNPAALAISRQTGANLKALIRHGLTPRTGSERAIPAPTIPGQIGGFRPNFVEFCPAIAQQIRRAS